jgi:hypothetical protein
MSAYIVDKGAICRIVSYLYSKAHGPDINSYWDKTQLHKMGFDLQDSISCAELAQKMFELNVIAVKDRYGERDLEQLQPLDLKYQFIPGSLIEVIKALECWLYQCLEGNVPNLALYKAMKEAHCNLSIEYVHQTEEFEAAPWG